MTNMYKLKAFIQLISDPSKIAAHFKLWRIGKNERFTASNTDILGSDLRYADPASFLSGYKEIFKNEIYRFKANSDKPHILDCGANIGLSVIYFKKLYPKAVITAFEPDKAIFQILKQNMHAFSLNDVELIEKGVSDKLGSVDFFSDGADGGRIAQGDEKNLIKIETVRLADYLDKPIDMLKIDIEGAELDVLRDCQPLLHNVANLFVEYHSFAKAEQNLSELLDIIKSAGFRYYISQSGTSVKSPFVNRKKDLGMDLQLNVFAFRQ